MATGTEPLDELMRDDSRELVLPQPFMIPKGNGRSKPSALPPPVALFPEEPPPPMGPVIPRMINLDDDAPPVMPVEVPSRGKPGRQPAKLESVVLADRAWKRPGFFRNHLKSIVPSTEQVKVYKRDDLGGVGYIRSYNEKDLDRATDIEEFISRFIVPTHGYGQYEIALVNAKGETSTTSAISILAPQSHGLSGGGGGGMSDGVAHVIDRLTERVEQLSAANQQTPQTFQQKIEELESLRRMMTPKEGQPADLQSTLALAEKIYGSSDNRDRELRELKEEIARIRLEASRAPQPMPAPLPPPPPDTSATDMFRMLLESQKNQPPPLSVNDLVALAKSLAPPPPPPPPPAAPKQDIFEIIKSVAAIAPLIKQVFGLDQTQAQIESLRREIVEANKTQPRGLLQQLEEVRAVQSMMAASVPAGGGDGETVWGFLSTLAENIPAVSEMVGAMRDKENAAKKAELIRRRQAALAARERRLPPPAAPQAPPAPAAPAAAAPTPAATALDGTLDEDPPEEPELEIPDEFEEHAARINAATDDLELVEGVLKGLQWLGMNDKSWRKVLFGLVAACRLIVKKNDEGAKKHVLEFITSWAEDMTGVDEPDDEPWIKPELKDKIIEVFQKNLVDIAGIVSRLGKKPRAAKSDPAAPGA